MHINELKNKLSKIRETKVKTYKFIPNIKTLHTELLDELDFYSGIIPEFFSYQHEAEKIKALYRKLKTLDYMGNKVVSCIDVERAGSSYREYFEGMVSFINNYIDEACNNGENLPLLQKQLQTAIEGDPMFIESLFGGKNNERQNVELTEAIKNVEYLVDFLDALKCMRTTLNEVIDRCFNTQPSTDLCKVVTLLTNSVSNFSNRVIYTIMDTYEIINCSLDNRPVKNVDTSFKVF